MDKREQIARMAQTKEDEMLLAKIYERMTNAAARNIPAATGFLSKREQMLAAELLRRAYIDSVVGDLRQQLDNTYIVDSKGNKRKLRQ